MDLQQYLARIGYHDALSPTLTVLQHLQKAHLLHIPFENLDIHRGRPIDLERTYDKVVLQGRGGFCYELNGLFSLLLKEIGFDVKMISARVYNSEKKQYGPEFDHMAIITTLGETEYLVDVGFGEFTFAPLQIEVGLIQKDPRGAFRIDTEDGITFIVLKNAGDVFFPQYSFTKIPRVLHDFLDMCHYHQTSPDSHFTQKRMCSMPTERGRISLIGNILKFKEGDQITEIHLKTEVEFKNTLGQYFTIKL